MEEDGTEREMEKFKIVFLKLQRMWKLTEEYNDLYCTVILCLYRCYSNLRLLQAASIHPFFILMGH